MSRSLPLMIVISATFLVLFSCNNRPGKEGQVSNEEKLKKMTWILGEWIQRDSTASFHEQWKLASDNSFIGTGFMMMHEDTVFAEDLQIKISGSDIFYIPTLVDQNNGKEVLFRLDSISENLMVFVNPQHDFPTRIVYFHPSVDSLHAWIEGTENGKHRREDFRMTRK